MCIRDSGYTDDLILQDRVPGNDEYMRVLTSYSDRNGKVRMMCLGHVPVSYTHLDQRGSTPVFQAATAKL